MNEAERKEIIDSLLKEHNIYDIVSFNEINVQDKLLENSYMKIRYNDLYQAEKMVLDQLNDKMETLVGTIYDELRFNQDKELTKQEIEKYYIPRDPKVKKMKEIIARQMVRVEFFDNCVKGLSSMGWNMREFCTNMRKGL